MATVSKAIQEESEQINAVKKIVKEKVSKIKKVNLQESPISEGKSWKVLKEQFV